jgi:hypothetical protein
MILVKREDLVNANCCEQGLKDFDEMFPGGTALDTEFIDRAVNIIDPRYGDTMSSEFSRRLVIDLKKNKAQTVVVKQVFVHNPFTGINENFATQADAEIRVRSLRGEYIKKNVDPLFAINQEVELLVPNTDEIISSLIQVHLLY